MVNMERTRPQHSCADLTNFSVLERRLGLRPHASAMHTVRLALAMNQQTGEAAVYTDLRNYRSHPAGPTGQRTHEDHEGSGNLLVSHYGEFISILLLPVWHGNRQISPGLLRAPVQVSYLQVVDGAEAPHYDVYAPDQCSGYRVLVPAEHGATLRPVSDHCYPEQEEIGCPQDAARFVRGALRQLRQADIELLG